MVAWTRLSMGLALWIALAPAVSAAPTDVAAPTPAQRLELETLKGQLSDPAHQAQTRREAALLLLTRPYPQAASLACDFLNDASNRPAQVALAEAILETGRTDPAFIKPLLAMLSGNEPSVRSPAAAALATYKDVSVLEEFGRIASDGKTAAEVRLMVIEAMGGVIDKKAADALVALLDDPKPAVVNAACGALGRLTSIRAFKQDTEQWKKWWTQNRDKPQSEWLNGLAENLAKSNAALRATAADPEKHRAYLLRASLIESVRKRQAENG